MGVKGLRVIMEKFIKIPISIFVIVSIFILNLSHGNAQQTKTQKLNEKLRLYKGNDTIKTDLLAGLAEAYLFINPDSAKIIANINLALTTQIKDKKGRAKTLLTLGSLAHREGNGKKGIRLCEEALSINQSIQFKSGVALALKRIAIIHHEEGRLDTALSKYLTALEIVKEENDQSAISDYYNNIGNLYINKGNYVLALEYMYNALQLREALNDSLRIEITLGNLSGIYFDLKKLDETEKLSKRARVIQKNIGDIEGLVQTATMLGSVYAERGKYVEAIEYYEEAIENAKTLKNIAAEAVSLSNLGDIYLKIKMPETALKLFMEALNISLTLEDTRAISVNEISAGHALLNLNRIAESISYLERGYKNAKKIENVLGEMAAANHLAVAYEKIGNPYQSIAFHKIYREAKANLFTEETSLKAQQIEFNYLLEKKQNEISLLEKEKSLKEAKDNFIELLITALIALILLLTLIVVLIHKYRVKETKAKELILTQQAEIINQTKNLEDLNLFKDQTFSILSHDLRTPMANLNGILGLVDVALLSPEELNTMILKLKEQFKSINLLLENTLHWAKSQMQGEMQPMKETVKISDIVYRNFDLFKENIQQKEIAVKFLSKTDLSLFVDPNHLDIILRNIILNAIKFTPKKGYVVVESFIENGLYNISVNDNGDGMSEEKVQSLFKYNKQSVSYGTAGEKGAGIGLILTHEIALRNNGSIKVKSEPNVGTTFTLSFPVTT